MKIPWCLDRFEIETWITQGKVWGIQPGCISPFSYPNTLQGVDYVKNKQDVLRKIQKALALANNNPSVEESQTALLMAQRLAIQHGIEMAELNEQSLGTREVLKHEIKSWGNSCWWRERLMVIIGNNFKCEHYRDISRSNGRKAYRLVLVGFVEDIEIASAVYSHAEKSILFHAREYIRKMGKRIKSANKNKFRDEYIKGYLSGLSSKFKEQVEQNNWGLILVKDALVVQATSHMQRYSIKTPKNISKDDNAFEKGFKQGKGYVFPVGMIN